jgi:glucokinase
VRLTERARAGDSDALAAFERVAGSLAVGAMNLVFCFMPQRVVIGGGVAEAGDLLLDPIRDYFAREGPVMATVPDVVASERGDDSGLLGGLALWLDLADDGEIERRPALPIARP